MSADQGFQLGDRVTFTRTLSRRSERNRDQPHGGNERKYWTAEDWPGQPEPAPREGIIAGRRTLSDGVNFWGYDGEPTEYRPQRVFRAYLVAYALNRRPVLVLPEHVQPGSLVKPASACCYDRTTARLVVCPEHPEAHLL